MLLALDPRSSLEVSIRIRRVKISFVEAETNESKSSFVIWCSDLKNLHCIAARPLLSFNSPTKSIPISVCEKLGFSFAQSL